MCARVCTYLYVCVCVKHSKLVIILLSLELLELGHMTINVQFKDIHMLLIKKLIVKEFICSKDFYWKSKMLCKAFIHCTISDLTPFFSCEGLIRNRDVKVRARFYISESVKTPADGL